MRKNQTAKIGGFPLASLNAGTSLTALGIDHCDLGNDNIIDATYQGNDRDLDIDQKTDAEFGGNDTDQNNDSNTDKYIF